MKHTAPTSHALEHRSPGTQVPARRRRAPRLRLAITHAFLICLIAVLLIPLAMVISSSFNGGNAPGGSIIPSNPSLEHWREILKLGGGDDVSALTWLLNSVKVSTVSALLVVLLSTSAAYAFARLPFRFKTQILNSLLILQMFPMVVALVAIYGLLDTLGTVAPWMGLNTHPGLMFAYVGGVAGNIWMIKGYFDTIPGSMEEAAMIDGATPFQTFWMVLLPMSMPALVVTFILAFIGTIGEYPLASVVLQNTKLWTLAVGANSFLYEQHYRWGAFAATAVMAGVPITVMFLLCQRFLVSGLTAGGAKE